MPIERVGFTRVESLKPFRCRSSCNPGAWAVQLLDAELGLHAQLSLQLS